jgi:hypothetical protein
VSEQTVIGVPALRRLTILPPNERARLQRRARLLAYLSVALLVGLLLNALAGWWWADPAAALVIAAVALHEGRESWRGESCCDTC